MISHFFLNNYNRINKSMFFAVLKVYYIYSF